MEGGMYGYESEPSSSDGGASGWLEQAKAFEQRGRNRVEALLGRRITSTCFRRYWRRYTKMHPRAMREFERRKFHIFIIDTRVPGTR